MDKKKYHLPGLSEEELDRIPERGRKFHKQIVASINRSLNQADRKYDGDVIAFFAAYTEIVKIMERQFFDEEAVQKAKDFAEEILDVLLDEFDEEQRAIVYKRLDEARAVEK